MENKAYTLRDLTGDDLFLMMRVIRKIGIKEVKTCFESAEVRKAIVAMSNGKDVKDASAVGVTVMLEIADLLVSRLPECRDELYQLLSTLSGMKTEDIAQLPMLTMVDMVMDVVKKREFGDFFQRLFGSANAAT